VNLKTLLVGAAFIAATTPAIANASNLGVDFDPSLAVYVAPSGPWTLGYAFQDLTATSVVGLGAWNSGIQGDVTVGLWDSGQNLLASATVNSSSTVVGTASWVFTSITPVALTVGDTYYVGAYGRFNYTDTINPVTVAPEISYLYTAYELGFASPSGSPNDNDHGFFGGNVQLAGGVPEPATWAMMGLGFLGAGAAMRRRRGVAAVA
jgi:hypothetical protein